MVTISYNYKSFTACGVLAFNYLKCQVEFENTKIPDDVWDLHIKYVFLFLKQGGIPENKFLKKFIKGLKPDVKERIKLSDSFEIFFRIVTETSEERQERLKTENEKRLANKKPWEGKVESEIREALEKARKDKLETLDHERKD